MDNPWKGVDDKSAFQILENLPSAILVVDDLGFILYFNKRVGKILNLEKQNLNRKLLSSVLIPFHKMREIAETESEKGISNRCLIKIGKNKEITIGFSLSEVKIEEDKTVYVISFQNIEKVKTLENERNQLLQQSAIQNTLHSILHEVKNPIAAITAIVELAIEDLDGVNIHSRLNWVIGLCDKLSEHKKSLNIEDTKPIFNQIEQLKSKLEILLNEYKKTDLERELNSIFSECKRVNLIFEGISCIGDKLLSNKLISVDQSLKEALLILNAKAVQSQVILVDNIEPMPNLPFNHSVIRSIIFNLVINAIKYSPPGSRIEVNSYIDVKTMVFYLSVKDSGIGMSKEVKDHALELFYTTDEKGSGIGLALVHEFVHGAGGNIQIISAEDKGTEINISIPNIKIDEN